jgi:hypothetical protein
MDAQQTLSEFLRAPPVKTAAHLLFERLPDRLFSVLASPNRYRYWGLLFTLYEKRFGPEAPLPPSAGFLSREIIHDIEIELQYQDTWEDDEGNSPDTPLGIRAVGVFNQLVSTEWIYLEKRGYERRVLMRPIVSQFLDLLVQFAEKPPVFVAGKILSIYANLQLIIEGAADAPTLMEAAAQSRGLLEHIRNTGTNVRDLMASLGPETSTKDYVQRFFNDYIEQVFIGDYRELRTKNHPLARRGAILEMVTRIHATEPYRNKLLDSYRAKSGAVTDERALRLFERDIQRLRDLAKIDEYLDRLDTEVRTANRRALAALNYRMRTARSFDRLIDGAIANVLANPHVGSPFGAGELMSEDRIAEPKHFIDRKPPAAIRRKMPSDEEIARSNLSRRARDARTMTPRKALAYINDLVAAYPQLASHQIPLNTITEVRAYQALQVAVMAVTMRGRDPLADLLKRTGIVLKRHGNEEVTESLISGIPFEIERRAGREPKENTR